jgi:NADH dehydrogenase [ubiquinone] 1 alpha subcomplex assembly factor 5
MEQADVFDRRARAGRQERAARSPREDRWLNARMLEEIGARAGERPEPQTRALFVGDCAGLALSSLLPKAQTIEYRGLNPVAEQWCEEDALGLEGCRFELIVANGTLDSVNDLPGALIQMRRALAPGGLFLGAFAGAGTLEALRSIVQNSPLSHGKSRFHPQIDVRAAGDLLARAGFAEPVADTETITARYGQLNRLIGDVRANGLANALPNAPRVSRRERAEWLAGFDAARDGDGKVAEQFCPVFLTGRSVL